jgi:hypothetical protein
VYEAGGTVTMTNAVLWGNSAQGGQGSASGGNSGDGSGGGMYVAGGTATLSNVTLNDNTAAGGNGNNLVTLSNGGNGFGGGLYVAGGTIALTQVNVSGNTAAGGRGARSWPGTGPGLMRGLPSTPLPATSGGSGFGGGMYVAGGTLTLTMSNLGSSTQPDGTLLAGNSALGGDGGGWSFSYGKILKAGQSGNGLGGGLYAAGGSVQLLSDAVQGNTAQGGVVGGSLGNTGLGEGGGLYLAAHSAASLDAFTSVTSNTADPDPDPDPNIHGKYKLI